MYPGTILDDSPMDARKVMIGGMSGILGEWGPEDRDNVYENQITSRKALSQSKISASVRLGTQAGLENVVQLAENAGMKFEGDLKKFNATFLGRNPTSMQDLALAYTIFPNNGRRPEKTHIISSIRDRSGNVIYSPNIAMKPEEVVDRYTAYQVNSILTDTLRSGNAADKAEKAGLGKYMVAGKTGTEYGFTDNWFMGYTTEVTCAVWTGFDQTKSIYPGAFSKETVLPVWVKIMNATAGKFEPRAFLPPPDADQVEVCYKSGQLASDNCYELRQNSDGLASQVSCSYVEYLRPGTGTNRVCHIHGNGSTRLRNLANGPITGPLRAQPVIVASANPVFPAAPTLIAEDDPYDSQTPVMRARISVATSNPDEPGTESDSNGLPVARPIISNREVRELPAQRVKLPPPRAIQFD